MMRKKFSEEKIIRQIEQDAEELKIPDSLKPEAVLKKLEGRSPDMVWEEPQGDGSGKRRRGFHVYAKTMAAAAAALVVAIGGVGAMEVFLSGNSSRTEYKEYSRVPENGSQVEAEGQTIPVKKKDKVGDQYYLAADYDEIDRFYQEYLKEWENAEYLMTDGAYAGMKQEDLTFNSASSGMKQSAAAENGEEMMPDASAPSGAIASSDAADERVVDYSKTNTMVEGVDEADIIKTDGSYIYICRDEEISIVDISGGNAASGKMEAISVIAPEMGDAGSIHEIYVDGDRLIAIYSVIDSSLNNQDPRETASDDSMSMIDVEYEINENETLTMATYDISDRRNPKLQGTVFQDGGYNTSRKVGDYVYLFSQKNYFAHTAGGKDGIVPEINGEKAPADCIYLPEEKGCSSLIAASVKITDPSTVADQMVIYNDYCQIYMSTDAIYLYNEFWSGDPDFEIRTNIAKFSYEDGKMDAVDAVMVKGSVEDNFAVHGSDKGLQILTTDYNDEVNGSINRLYLFDGKMKKTAMLDNIAVGEEIYAARYIGDIVYFITYHNTDPLFAVDISDISSPKILGSLKISGFSDYLHPYGDNLLLGIGYETDPETSERLGVKLVMFDISDPADLKVLDTVIIKDMYYTQSATDYKSVLANPDKNLIGVPMGKFIGSKEDDKSGKYLKEGWKEVYQIYRWEDGKFRKAMSMDLGVGRSNLRGLYSGNIFYHICSKGTARYIESFDMENEFKKLDKLTLGE